MRVREWLTFSRFTQRNFRNLLNRDANIEVPYQKFLLINLSLQKDSIQKYVHNKITKLSVAAKYKRNKMHMIRVSELYYLYD